MSITSIKPFHAGQKTATFQYKCVCVVVNNLPQPDYVLTDYRPIKEFTSFFYVEV